MAFHISLCIQWSLSTVTYNVQSTAQSLSGETISYEQLHQLAGFMHRAVSIRVSEKTVYMHGKFKFHRIHVLEFCVVINIAAVWVSCGQQELGYLSLDIMHSGYHFLNMHIAAVSTAVTRRWCNPHCNTSHDAAAWGTSLIFRVILSFSYFSIVV